MKSFRENCAMSCLKASKRLSLSIPIAGFRNSCCVAETGGICIAPRPSSPGAPIKPGMPMRPFFGINPVLVDEKVGTVKRERERECVCVCVCAGVCGQICLFYK